MRWVRPLRIIFFQKMCIKVSFFILIIFVSMHLIKNLATKSSSNFWRKYEKLTSHASTNQQNNQQEQGIENSIAHQQSSAYLEDILIYNKQIQQSYANRFAHSLDHNSLTTKKKGLMKEISIKGLRKTTKTYIQRAQVSPLARMQTNTSRTTLIKPKYNNKLSSTCNTMLDTIVHWDMNWYNKRGGMLQM